MRIIMRNHVSGESLAFTKNITVDQLPELILALWKEPQTARKSSMRDLFVKTKEPTLEEIRKIINNPKNIKTDIDKDSCINTITKLHNRRLFVTLSSKTKLGDGEVIWDTVHINEQEYSKHRKTNMTTLAALFAEPTPTALSIPAQNTADISPNPATRGESRSASISSINSLRPGSQFNSRASSMSSISSDAPGADGWMLSTLKNPLFHAFMVSAAVGASFMLTGPGALGWLGMVGCAMAAGAATYLLENSLQKSANPALENTSEPNTDSTQSDENKANNQNDISAELSVSPKGIYTSRTLPIDGNSEGTQPENNLASRSLTK